MDSQLMPITAVSVLGRGSTLCPLCRYEVLNTSQYFIFPPQCPGASTWQGGVTMNDAYACAKSTIQFKDPCHKNLVFIINVYFTKFGKSKLPFTSLHKIHMKRHSSLAKSGQRKKKAPFHRTKCLLEIK
jgi:hypothetical protein